MEFYEENLGVDETEVADPSEVESEETQDVAEPVTEKEETQAKDERDSAFAAQRRALQEAEKRAAEAEQKLAEMNAANNARAEVLKRLSGSETADVDALAESLGIEAGDVVATLEAEQVKAKLELENQRLREELSNAQVDKAMQEDLITLQKLDPNIKDLSELGTDYADYISSGLTAEQAYYAVKAKEINTKQTPPAEIGKIDNKATEKDYFTEAEVDAMTPAQQKANADKILASMSRW